MCALTSLRTVSCIWEISGQLPIKAKYVGRSFPQPVNCVCTPKNDKKLVTLSVEKAAKVNLMDEGAVITLLVACLFIGLILIPPENGS